MDIAVSSESVEVKWGYVGGTPSYGITFTESFPSYFSESSSLDYGSENPMLKFSFKSRSVTIYNNDTGDINSKELGYSFYVTGAYYDDNTPNLTLKIGAFASNQDSDLCNIASDTTAFTGSGSSIYNDFFLGSMCDTTTFYSDTDLSDVTDFHFYITGTGGYYHQCGATVKGVIDFPDENVTVLRTAAADFAPALGASSICGKLFSVGKDVIYRFACYFKFAKNGFFFVTNVVHGSKKTLFLFHFE